MTLSEKSLYSFYHQPGYSRHYKHQRQYQHHINVQLKSFAAHDEDGRKMLEIVLNNQGTQHALLQNLKLDLKDAKGGTLLALSGEKELQGLTGEGILANHERRFLMAWPEKLTTTPAHIDIAFDKQAF